MSLVFFVLAWGEVTVSLRLVACGSFGVSALSVGWESVVEDVACWSTLVFSAFLVVLGLGIGISFLGCGLLTLRPFRSAWSGDFSALAGGPKSVTFCSAGGP